MPVAGTVAVQVATPPAIVVALHAVPVTPVMVKLTVAPTIAAPVAVSVSVALRVSVAPLVVGFGVGGASNSVVVFDVKPTTTVPIVMLSVESVAV